MRVRTLISVATLCSIMFADCSQSQWITFNCPDEGVTVRVPRKVSASYGTYGRQYESEYRAIGKALGQLRSQNTPADSLKSEVARFTEYLSRERGAIQTKLRTMVRLLQKTPCKNENRKAFGLLLQTIEFSAGQLDKITEACSDTTADIMSMLQAYQSDKE